MLRHSSSDSALRSDCALGVNRRLASSCSSSLPLHYLRPSRSPRPFLTTHGIRAPDYDFWLFRRSCFLCTLPASGTVCVCVALSLSAHAYRYVLFLLLLVRAAGVHPRRCCVLAPCVELASAAVVSSVFEPILVEVKSGQISSQMRRFETQANADHR